MFSNEIKKNKRLIHSAEQNIKIMRGLSVSTLPNSVPKEIPSSVRKKKSNKCISISFYRPDEMLAGIFHHCSGGFPHSIHIRTCSVLLETVKMGIHCRAVRIYCRWVGEPSLASSAEAVTSPFFTQTRARFNKFKHFCNVLC